jgi:hypothetical protein
MEETLRRAGVDRDPSAAALPDLGTTGRWLARLLRPRKRPTLVLSLPRSGSSWVGNLLGSAPDALYLREPVTQSEPRFHRMGTVFHIDRPELIRTFRRHADRAFRADPGYPVKVISFPHNWGLRRRLAKRLVVKEVNPYAAPWYLHWYRPRLIFLVRHPAGVALSFRKLGWIGAAADEWERNGTFQATALRAAHQAIEGAPRCLTVSYEALCDDPLGGFEALYRFAGLSWDEGVRDYVERYSVESRRTAWAWREEVPADMLEGLRRGFGRVKDVPWFQAGDDWR